MTSRIRGLVCAFCVIGWEQGLVAQFPTKPLTTEMSFYGGGSFDFPGAGAAAGGFSLTTPGAVELPRTPRLVRGQKSQLIAGGTMAFSLTRFLWLYGDYGYMFPDRQQADALIPISAIVFSTTIPDVSTTNRHYWTATGGVEVSLPTVHRIVPLVRFGGGYVHHSYNFYWPALAGRVNDVTYSIPELNVVKAENIPAVTFGGGLRWYWGERHGLRFLVDGFRLSHGVTDAQSRRAVPVFWGSHTCLAVAVVALPSVFSASFDAMCTTMGFVNAECAHPLTGSRMDLALGSPH